MKEKLEEMIEKAEAVRKKFIERVQGISFIGDGVVKIELDESFPIYKRRSYVVRKFLRGGSEVEIDKKEGKVKFLSKVAYWADMFPEIGPTEKRELILLPKKIEYHYREDNTFYDCSARQWVDDPIQDIGMEVDDKDVKFQIVDAYRLEGGCLRGYIKIRRSKEEIEELKERTIREVKLILEDIVKWIEKIHKVEVG